MAAGGWKSYLARDFLVPKREILHEYPRTPSPTPSASLLIAQTHQRLIINLLHQVAHVDGGFGVLGVGGGGGLGEEGAGEGVGVVEDAFRATFRRYLLLG